MEYTNEPKEFTFESNGKTYIYDFTNLTIEQAELSREIIEWKYTQRANPADNFQTVINSKGAEWKTILLSYLLTEKDKPFKLVEVEKVQEDIKLFPAKYLEQIEELILDFFYHIKLNRSDFMTLQGKLKQSGIETFTKLLQTLQMTNLNAISSSTNSNDKIVTENMNLDSDLNYNG